MTVHAYDMADARPALPNDTATLQCSCSRLMGSDAFRSLFTLYQSQTKVSSHIQLISPGLMTDSEELHGEGADHKPYPMLPAVQSGQVRCTLSDSGGNVSSWCAVKLGWCWQSWRYV